MREELCLTGKPTAVMQKIVGAWKNNPALDDADAPKSVHSFTRHLNCIRPNLEAMGFEILRSKSGERKLTINSPAYVRAVQATKSLTSEGLSEGGSIATDVQSHAQEFSSCSNGLDATDTLGAHEGDFYDA